MTLVNPLKLPVFLLGIVFSPLVLQAMNSQSLQSYIESQNSVVQINKQSINASRIKSVYEKRQFQSAWTLAKVRALQALIVKIKEHGISPKRYSWSDEGLSDLQKEVLYTDTLIRIIENLSHGQVDPSYVDSNVRFQKNPFTDVKVINAILSTNTQEDLISQVEALAPTHPYYNKLKAALAYYRTEQVKKLLSKKISASNIQEVEERLTVLGYGGSASLQAKIRKFQADHSLDITGSIGPNTMITLTMDAKERIRQIRINMERLRWLPQQVPGKYIFVNLANQKLTVYDSEAENGVALEMIVQNGSEFRKTPQMVTQVRQVILNPTWTAPEPIAIKDLLPRVRKDKESYLEASHLGVYLKGTREKIEDPSEIDWSKVNQKNNPYYFVQEAGPFNTLGMAKFMLTNNDSIFMHDTDHKPEFNRTNRLTSSGCIRVSKPLELAEYVLQNAGNGEWTVASLKAQVATGAPGEIFEAEKPIEVKKLMPVYLSYINTVVVDDQSKVLFLPDYYKLDAALKEALFANKNDADEF